MKKVIINGLREVHYMKLMPTCGLSAYKEVYTRTIVKADIHDEAMELFKKHLVTEKVTDVVTSVPVYVYIHDDETSQLKWNI